MKWEKCILFNGWRSGNHVSSGVVRVDGFHAMGGHGLEFILRCLRQLLGGKSDTLSVHVCLWESETA